MGGNVLEQVDCLDCLFFTLLKEIHLLLCHSMLLPALAWKKCSKTHQNNIGGVL